MTTTMDINEAKHHLAQLLNLAKNGKEVFISEGNLPVARLTAVAPISPPRTSHVAGLHAGAIWISDDFNEELSGILSVDAIFKQYDVKLHS